MRGASSPGCTDLVNHGIILPGGETMDKKTNQYKGLILKRIKQMPYEDIKELANYVQFLYINRKADDFEQLVDTTRAAAETKGYRQNNINKAIRAVRKRS